MVISVWGFLFLFSGSSRESPDFSGIPENYSRQKRLYILLILETLGNLPEQENFYGKRIQESSKISTKKIKILIKPGIKYERSEYEIKY